MVTTQNVDVASRMPVATAAAPRQAALLDRTDIAWVAHRVGNIALVVVTAIGCLFPVYYVFGQALEDGFAGVREMFQRDETWTILRTTVALGGGSVVFATVLGTILGWCAHCLPPKRRWMGVLPLFPLAMPPLAMVTGYAFLFSPSIGFVNTALRWTWPFENVTEGPLDIYTVYSMAVVAGLGFAAFVYLFVRSSLSQIHQDLIDAAAVSGAGSLSLFFRVVLPLIRPALVYGTMTVTLLALGQFVVPLILGRQVGVVVLTTGMFREMATSPANPALASAYGMPILVVGLLFLVLQRLGLRNQERFVTAGGKGSRPMTHNGPLSQAVLVVYGILTVLLPLLALIVVALQPYWSENIIPSDFTLENIRMVFERPDLVRSVRNSLTYGFGAVAVTLPLGYLCARTIYRRRNKPWLANIQDVIVSMPLGIPAVIFGMGFLLAFTRSPVRLYGNGWGMVVVYSVILLPFSTRLQLVALTGLGSDLDDAAAVHGAGLLRRVFRVDLPLLRPALGSAAALVVLMTTHEFGASILVRSTRTEVMGTALHDLWFFASYPLTAVMALLMCFVTLLAVGIALVIGGRGAFGRTE